MWLFGAEPGRLGKRIVVFTEREEGFEASFETVESDLVEPGRFGSCELVVGDVDERRSTPECEPAGQYRQGELRIVGSLRCSTLPKQLLETYAIEGERRNLHPVPRGHRLDRLATELVPEMRNIELDELRRRGRRLARPKRFDDPLDRSDGTVMQEEIDEQCALFRRADRDLHAFSFNLERPEHPELGSS